MNKQVTPISILFYRDFDQYSGGHQKVFDYFSHVNSSDRFSGETAFSKETIWNSTNPWFPAHMGTEVLFCPARYDLIFLAGMDWVTYLATDVDPLKPVINLIQHVRHATPGENVYPFISQKAIRICVSPEVSEAIESTGLVNGPVFTIANGILVPSIERQRTKRVMISGFKNAGMALDLYRRFENLGIEAHVQIDQLPRDEYLGLLASTDISILLPSPVEGFYLPALESMKLASLTIVPDCVGNRGFCIDLTKDSDKGNCFVPRYDAASIVAACQDALTLLQNKDRVLEISHNARAVVERYSLERERQAFFDILDNVEELWANI